MSVLQFPARTGGQMIFSRSIVRVRSPTGVHGSGCKRKESILEFVNTEASYGEDLRIIKEEFYLPMQSAGLLTQEQLLVVFSNIQELIDLNESFLEYLQEEIDQAFDQVQSPHSASLSAHSNSGWVSHRATS
uniref:DH domain-containing protein n=1 Tax=Chelydra serpentina TaxID=8475 RepID=A0A8C3SGM3_CHESE